MDKHVEGIWDRGSSADDLEVDLDIVRSRMSRYLSGPKDEPTHTRQVVARYHRFRPAAGIRDSIQVSTEPVQSGIEEKVVALIHHQLDLPHEVLFGIVPECEPGEGEEPYQVRRTLRGRIRARICEIPADCPDWELPICADSL